MRTSTKISAEERHAQFMSVFRNFDTIGAAVDWIADVTGSSFRTVMIWRCKKKSGYKIPSRPYKMLMDAVAQRFPQ